MSFKAKKCHHFRNLSQGSSDTGFCGSMEKKDKRRKKLDDGKPNAENVINELLEGVDLKQGPTGEADSKYLTTSRKDVPGSS